MSEGKHFGVVRELHHPYDSGPEAPEASSGEDARARLQAEVARLVPPLGEWRRRYPFMSESRLTSVAQAIVAPLPGAPLEQHLVLGKLGLVDFALDDVADGEVGQLSDEEIHEACARYARLAHAEPVAAWRDEGSVAARLGRAVEEVAGELRGSPGAGRFLPLWREHFRRFCVSHQSELRHKRQYEATRRLPLLKDYLTRGWWSSGAPMYCAAVLVVRAPDYSGDALQDPLLRRALLHLGLAIRWFNDARSLDRERSEGKFNNALVLLMAGGKTEAESERLAVAQGDRNLARLRRVVGRLPPELQSWGQGMITLGGLSRRVYLQHGEFHHPGADGHGGPG